MGKEDIKWGGAGGKASDALTEKFPLEKEEGKGEGGVLFDMVKDIELCWLEMEGQSSTGTSNAWDENAEERGGKKAEEEEKGGYGSGNWVDQELRARIYRTFEEPSSSCPAMILAAILLVSVISSSTVVIIETLPEVNMNAETMGIRAMTIIDYTTLLIFSLEFLFRFLCCPSVREFLLSPMNYIDAMSILPGAITFFFRLKASSSKVQAIFRAMRLSRILRSLKIIRYSPDARLFFRAMRRSLQPLSMLLLLLGLAMILLSTLIHLAERGEYDIYRDLYVREDGLLSPFNSIPSSFWWCIATMTTVGYGDDVPLTPIGKCVAAIAMLSGIITLSLPMTVIGTNFTEESKQLAERRQREKQSRNNNTNNNNSEMEKRSGKFMGEEGGQRRREDVSEALRTLALKLEELQRIIEYQHH